MAKQHILPRLMRRFAAAGSRSDLLTCARLLDSAPAIEHRRLLMSGFEAAFAGRALPPLPEPLLDALARSGVASPHLRVRLREPDAIADALRAAGDEATKLDERLLCVRLFGEVHLPESVPALLDLAASATSPELRKAALTSLLLYDDAAIGAEIVRIYPELPSGVQPAAQTLLASRAAWTLPWLAFLERHEDAAATVPPATVALLREHEDKAVAEHARKVFAGAEASTAAEHRAEIERLRNVIAAGPGDAYKGGPLFEQRCAACHTLFHKGGRIGPDLTAYQRDDLGTLLPSIVDPSADIREGYVNQLITTTDGRTLSGFVVGEDAAAIVLRGLDGQDVSLARASLREIRRAPASIMPAGLLTGLSDQELRDFFAFLRLPQPIAR